MRGADGPDDGQAQPGAVAGRSAPRRGGTARTATDQFGRSLGPLLRSERTRPSLVRSSEIRRRAGCAGRVVHQVADQRSSNGPVRRPGRPQAVKVQPAAAGPGPQRVDGVLGRGGQVDELAGSCLPCSLTASVSSASISPSAWARPSGATLAAMCLKLLRRAGRLGHRDVDRGPHHGERRPQLVRRVGDEPALAANAGRAVPASRRRCRRAPSARPWARSARAAHRGAARTRVGLPR